MKPKIYENAAELISDLNRAKGMCSGKTAKVQGKRLSDFEIMDRMIELAPGTFKYRDELIKAGVGTTRALKKFCDLASANLKDVADEEYEKNVRELKEEVDKLEDFGVADDIITTLMQSKEAINEHMRIESIINGFGKKLNAIMEKVVQKLEKVTKAHDEMVLKVRKNAKLLELNSEAVQLIKKSNEIIKQNEESIKALVPLMTEYCALNVGIMSIMMGKSMPSSKAKSNPAVASSELDNEEEDYEMHDDIYSEDDLEDDEM